MLNINTLYVQNISKEVDVKLLVAGSRSICNFDIGQYIDDVTLIINGGARGVDTLAEKYADEHKISKVILHPEYKKYGKAAPLVRNKYMVDICDKVLIIWDGKSSGTKYTIEYANKINKPITIINVSKLP